MPFKNLPKVVQARLQEIDQTFLDSTIARIGWRGSGKTIGTRPFHSPQEFLQKYILYTNSVSHYLEPCKVYTDLFEEGIIFYFINFHFGHYEFPALAFMCKEISMIYGTLHGQDVETVFSQVLAYIRRKGFQLSFDRVITKASIIFYLEQFGVDVTYNPPF